MTDQRQLSAYPPVQPLHVVVLEGDAALRQQILLPTLRAHCFAVHGAGSTTELYRHMLLRSFDIAVLGISLGGEDSFAVVQQLRAMSDIGIVVLTRDEDRQHHVRALRAGADSAPATDGTNADFKSVKPGTGQAVVLQAPQGATYYLRVVPQAGSSFTNISVLGDYSL